MNLLAHITTLQNPTKSMPFPPSPFTGKERDEETGYGYFGARYMDHELMTMWLSVDPMADKYPNISPYNYCMWNPVSTIDPNGRDGVKIINKDKRTITVKASYYVRTIPMVMDGKVLKESAYRPSEIYDIQDEINSYLNNQKFTYDIDGITYSVKFDLCFSDAGDNLDMLFLSDKESDLFYGYPIGNSFSKLSPTDAPTIFPERDKGNNKVLIRVGLTNLNKEIIMNSQYDNTRRKMHEIFHTLFFNQDDAPSGIGNYVPGVDMPTQEDINILLNNSQLPSIYE